VNSSIEFSVICVICGSCALSVAGIAYALQQGMELLGRLAVVIGISLVLTLLLLVLYQDDSAAANMQPLPTITAAVTATAPSGSGTP
jgi:hypothetical protein